MENEDDARRAQKAADAEVVLEVARLTRAGQSLPPELQAALPLVVVRSVYEYGYQLPDRRKTQVGDLPFPERRGQGRPPIPPWDIKVPTLRAVRVLALQQAGVSFTAAVCAVASATGIQRDQVYRDVKANREVALRVIGDVKDGIADLVWSEKAEVAVVQALQYAKSVDPARLQELARGFEALPEDDDDDD